MIALISHKYNSKVWYQYMQGNAYDVIASICLEIDKADYTSCIMQI
jgi:hypothetical protein